MRVILETLLLNVARTYDTLPNDSTALPRLLFSQFLERHRHYLNLNIDTVEQRTGNLAQIALHCPWRTSTSPRGMVVIATRARIHGSHQHEAGRITNRHFRTGNGDGTVFQRLAENLQHLPTEFRQLIEKQHSIVRQRNLARLGVGASANQRHIRNGMVRRTERALRHQRRFPSYQSRHRMYFGGFKRLTQRQRRQYGRYSFCQHRFSGTRRANHYNIMTTSGSHLKGAFNAFLTPHIRKIGIKLVDMRSKLITSIDHRRGDGLRTIQETGHLPQCFSAIYLERVHYRSLTGIESRDNQAHEPLLPRLD